MDLEAFRGPGARGRAGLKGREQPRRPRRVYDLPFGRAARARARHGAGVPDRLALD